MKNSQTTTPDRLSIKLNGPGRSGMTFTASRNGERISASDPVITADDMKRAGAVFYAFLRTKGTYAEKFAKLKELADSAANYGEFVDAMQETARKSL